MLSPYVSPILVQKDREVDKAQEKFIFKELICN